VAACGPHSPLAVPAAGWVVVDHPEITPPSNFLQLRDTTSASSAPYWWSNPTNGPSSAPATWPLKPWHPSATIPSSCSRQSPAH